MTRLVADSGATYDLDGPPRAGGEALVHPVRATLDGRRFAVRVEKRPGLLGPRADAQADLLEALAPTAAGPFVPGVWDRGTWEGRRFVVFAWYDETLATWAPGASPAARRAAARALVTAVAALHGEGRPHGDLKPANAAVLDEGDWVVLLDPAPPGHAPVTPATVAPERRAGGPPTFAADRWSLAHTVAEVLLGRPLPRRLPPGAWRALDAAVPGIARPLRALRRPAWARADDLGGLLATLEGSPPAAPRPGAGVGWSIAAIAAVALLVAAVVPTGPPPCPPGAVPRGGACATPDGLRVVRVPAGRFRMGADDPGDAPPHTVVLRRAFWIGESEVTQAQWRASTGEDPVRDRDQRLGPTRARLPCATWHGASLVDDDAPVVCVSFAEVAAWLNALSRKHGLQPSYTITDTPHGPHVVWDRGADGWRLPTEAEWEWAARAAGRPLEAPRTPCAANVRDASAAERWGGEPACDDGAPTLTRTRRYPANALGLFDLDGNAMEWVWDRYGALPSTGTTVDPAGAPTGIGRVRRGGSWNHLPRGPHARDAAAPDHHDFVTGFRVARTAR
jgi:sulfatase modifying factor 1